MNKRTVLILGAIAAAFATSVAFAQSSKGTEDERRGSDAEQTVQSDAERKAERRARNEAAAAARAKAGKQKEHVEEEEEEEERGKKP